MFRNLLTYINPLAHLGEKKYSVLFPLYTSVVFYIVSEIFAFFIVKHPNNMGNFNIILTFLLVIYFSFRSGIKGGFVTVAISVVFFTYYILIRQAPIAEKTFAVETALALTVVYGIIALILGGLKQTVDTMLFREKEARIRAEEVEERFRALANNIPNLCWTAKPDGYIFWFNSRWYEYTGKTQKQMVGWGWKKVHDASVLPEVLKRWKASIKTGKPFDMVFPLKGADGNYREFLTRTVPVFNKEGEILYWFGTGTDVTEQKQIERQKDDFISMASHELKTPLTSTKVFTQLLARRFSKINDSESQRILQKMDNNLSKLEELVYSLLDVSRIQHGKMQTRQEKFLIYDLAKEIVEDLQPITEHALVLDWHTREYVDVDKFRIRQVLVNLITNAIKYSPNAKKVIIGSRKNGDFIEIYVQDFGTGIPKAEQKKIFDRFYQANEHNTYPGLGLGLFISNEIVKANGGNMWVESEKGKGSTFYFTIPVGRKNES